MSPKWTRSQVKIFEVRHFCAASHPNTTASVRHIPARCTEIKNIITACESFFLPQCRAQGVSCWSPAPSSESCISTTSALCCEKHQLSLVLHLFLLLASDQPTCCVCLISVSIIVSSYFRRFTCLLFDCVLLAALAFVLKITVNVSMHLRQAAITSILLWLLL